jgi:hypothetical protein
MGTVVDADLGYRCAVNTYHQLDMVTQEQRRFEEAEATTTFLTPTGTPPAPPTARLVRQPQYVISIGGQQGMITVCDHAVVSEVRLAGLLAMSPSSQLIMH